uniref:Uncharacterized protein n=1 Tax=Amphimedon queenslandica TaxID=400682 RepID=A0A1X7T9L0_AMPQE
MSLRTCLLYSLYIFIIILKLCFFKKRYEYETNQDKLSVVSCTDSFQKKYRFL